MVLPRRPPVPLRQVDDRTSETAAGTAETEPGSRCTSLRQGYLGKAAQRHAPVGKLLQCKGQHPDRAGNGEYPTVAANRDGRVPVAPVVRLAGHKLPADGSRWQFLRRAPQLCWVEKFGSNPPEHSLGIWFMDSRHNSGVVSPRRGRHNVAWRAHNGRDSSLPIISFAEALGPPVRRAFFGVAQNQRFLRLFAPVLRPDGRAWRKNRGKSSKKGCKMAPSGAFSRV